VMFNKRRRKSSAKAQARLGIRNGSILRTGQEASLRASSDSCTDNDFWPCSDVLIRSRT
jgi:hypothetical protein